MKVSKNNTDCVCVIFYFIFFKFYVVGEEGLDW